ncbi:PREDICTED: proline-rich receptor-like protein kinase PERK4 [Lupinus angustifolius]|uniref:proline-rich receptor-like protein kinase PERK4 n=1 Tax=Lupinus angustifolius TaxID=3871 RepID=UPI00092EAE54|nr:PREDICTED: proline-rich receptor-like protein kinase PERK4 [Lupinus angustifolius]XP_019421421.1 PREDICTED: proline-rich receptor-like protein kinase PERK4 [Lupinus angustifolius]
MSSPDNSSPDNSTPDNATPDNSTPDDADNSSSPPSSSQSPPSPPSQPPPSEPSPSPPPPEKDSSPPPTPPSSNNSPPPPSSSDNPPPSSNNPPPPSSSNNPTPPPPASSGRSPPSPSGGSPSPPQHKPLPSNNNDNNNKTPSAPKSGNDNDNSDKAIIGAVLGVGAVLLILVIVCVICSRRKKKRKQMYYYGEQDAKGNNHYYNNSGQHPVGYYGGPRHPDHVVGVQSGMAPPNSGWGAPPPLMMNSAEMSSSFSTGPPPLPPPSPNLALGLKGTFSYEELAAATNAFNDQNLIGQGGFGYVHKGVLPNGKEIAVKSLKAGSGQGEREFQAEIDIISRVHHRHLVSLVGYCIAGGQRMLVYEFIPNNNLEHHLHGKGVPTMDWPTRMRIAIGSAKGLAYLHEDCHPRIIHRDIKTANVLIDDSFEAKVADFGLAKLTSDNNTHVSTRVMGTFGYLAPEYASSGKLTEKSDVFSFGVMLLELISGKRPVDLTNTMEDSLVDWARPLLTRGLEEDPGNFRELVDPFLEGIYNPHEMSRMAACAAGSIRHSARKRLKMSQIVRALEGDVSLDDLKEGMMKTGITNVQTTSSSSSDMPYDTMQYNHDMQKMRHMVYSGEAGTSSGSSAEMSRIQETPRRLN